MLPDMWDQNTSNLFRYLRENIPNFCVDTKMQKALCFRERLEVFYKNNSTEKLDKIGKYFISVESMGPRGQKLFVQISLSMTINSHPVVSKITSSATKELHCLEEKKYESSEIDNSLCQKNVYIGHGDNGYFVKVVEDRQSKAVCFFKDRQSKSILIPYTDAMFISDGCNILLMRYLAMTDFCGTLCLESITMEGNIAKCVYECSNVNMTIHNKDTEVLEIIQEFYINDIVSSTIKTILSKQGNILSINLINSPYVIKINPNVDYCIPHKEPIILPLREEWKEDFELLSKHFDKKILKKDRKKEYLHFHSEINELLSDYIQSLLCKKPDDVIEFTINYFKIITTEEN